MPYRLEEAHSKLDIAIEPKDLADATEVLSDFFCLDKYRRALFVVTCGQMLNDQLAALATTDILTAQVYCASDEAGTGAEVIVGATCVITANEDVQGARIDLDALDDGVSTVTINDVEYLYDTTPVAGTREFDNRAALIALINDDDLGVEGVIAVADGVDANQIVLRTVGRGEYTISLESDPGDDILIITDYALAYLEVNAFDCDLPDDKYFVAVSLEADMDSAITAALPASAVIIRAGSRHNVDQKVAASYNSQP
jgi:hypothetical protein